MGDRYPMLPPISKKEVSVELIPKAHADEAIGHLSNLGMELENIRLDTEADTEMAQYYLEKAMDALEVDDD